MSTRQRSVQYILLSVYFVLFFWLWFITVSIVTILFWLLRVKQIKRIISKRNGKKISVIYLEVFSPQNAGNRYRTGKWAEILNQNGFKASSKYVFEYNEYLRMVSHPVTMIFFHMEFLWKRLLQCLSSLTYDIVIVRREILMFNDYGNLFFEKLMFHIHPHLILDFDDDISAAKREPRTITVYGKLLMEHPQKFRSAMKYYSAFIPGTNYLKGLLISFYPAADNKNILVLPTCVDYDRYTPKQYNFDQQILTIGWAGTKGNLHHLDIIIPALNNLADKYKFKLLVIADEPYFPSARFRIENISWEENKEIENLQLIDIGVMPLENTLIAMGKGGLKLIQYMGCGLVSMATGLTVNNEIIDDGVNGFIVPADADWTTYFEKAFARKAEFNAIGNEAFQKVKNNFSFNANRDKLLEFLKQEIKR